MLYYYVTYKTAEAERVRLEHERQVAEENERVRLENERQVAEEAERVRYFKI